MTTATRDLARELREWDGTWPACWKPQPGESLVGRIVQYGTGQSSFGPVRTAIVEQDNGERVSLWLSSTVLLGLFREHRPKTGERIGLRFLGKHPTKNYKRYALIVDRPEAELSFEPLGGEVGDGLDPERHPYATAAVRTGRQQRSDDPFEWGE